MQLGFIAVDLYDGGLMYDYESAQPWVYDLDEYRSGPFVLEEDCLPGSMQLMAPDEFV